MARSFGSRRPAGSFSAPSGGGAPASWGGGSGSSPGGISIPSGAGGAAIGGAPTARSATASAAGAVYTVTRLLGSTSTLALASGSSSNLSLNTTTGVITAASAIAVGATQIAKITETLGDLRVDYPVNITGVSATPTPSPSPTLGDLTLSVALTTGTATSGSINGATSGSTISSNLAGLTIISGARTFSFDGTTAAGTTNNALTETLAGATNSPRNSPVTIGSGAAEILADPIMYVLGASLESNGQRGLMTPVAYGYSPQGPLQWSNYLANQRLFYIQMGWLNQEPYNYTRPSAYATGGARFNEGNTGGYSVNEQVDLAIASAQRLPAGKKKVAFYSGGRNDISSASTYVPKELANIDKLLAVFDLVIVPGLWKRDVAAAAGWQSGGSNRGYVDAINTRMATDLATRGNKVIHVSSLQSIMCESTGDQNPKPGYLVDGDTHLSVKGAYECGKAISAAIASRFAGATDAGNLVTVSGAGGTAGGGTTGTLPDGFSTMKDATISAAFSIPAAGSVAMTITRAVTQATVAEGATLTGPTQAVPAGGSYRMTARRGTPLPAITRRRPL